FALGDDRKSLSEADKCLGEAFAKPNAKKCVQSWAKLHPEFCALLVELAEDRIIRADKFAQKYDADDPRMDEEERDRELRRPGYQLAQEALIIAESLDPTSHRVQRLLATTEEVLGPIDRSYRRLTDLINVMPKKSDSDLRDLFFCRKLRGRV